MNLLKDSLLFLPVFFSVVAVFAVDVYFDKVDEFNTHQLGPACKI